MNDDARRQAEAFVREVDAAMVDLPRHRRAELTAGLVDHLLEPGEDGLRLIDDQPDPRSYADELRASAAMTGDRPGGRRVPYLPGGRRVLYLAGAAILAVVLAGAWIGVTHPWSGQSAPPEPTPTATTTSGAAQIQVPNVIGLSRDDALSRLRAVGLTVEVQQVTKGKPDPGPTHLASGTVAETEPAPGTFVDLGSDVIIMLTP